MCVCVCVRFGVGGWLGGGGGGVFPWQPDQGQHVTLFHWLSVLPYANEACASLQTLALVNICIKSTFACGKVGRERVREWKEWKNFLAMKSNREIFFRCKRFFQIK